MGLWVLLVRRANRAPWLVAADQVWLKPGSLSCTVYSWFFCFPIRVWQEKTANRVQPVPLEAEVQRGHWDFQDQRVWLSVSLSCFFFMIVVNRLSSL